MVIYHACFVVWLKLHSSAVSHNLHSECMRSTSAATLKSGMPLWAPSFLLNCEFAASAWLPIYALHVCCRQMGGQGPMQGQANHFFRCVFCLGPCLAGQPSSWEAPKIPAAHEDDAADSRLALLQICTRED